MAQWFRRGVTVAGPFVCRCPTVPTLPRLHLPLIDALGNRTTTLFDAVGNVTYVKDAQDNVTTFAYDALNRLSSQTDALGKTATFAYDAVGHLTSTTDRNGRRRDLAYDDAGRLTTETWVNAGGGTADILTYSYDGVSNLLSAANGNGAYTMSYDAVNRVTVAQEPFGVTLTFTYDEVGNRTVVQDSFGGVTSQYDALNRVSLREIGGASPLRLDLTYNPNGQLETLTRYKDLAGSNHVGSSTYTYDEAGRLTNLRHTDGSATTLGQYTYAYDAASRLTAEVINSATRTYTYDDASQLTADGTSTFSYDGTGNRTNTGYSTGTGNRLANTPTWTYEYDDEGNLTKQSQGPQDTTWTYGYDHRNQMVWAEQRAMDGGTLQQRSEYAYDVLGNRIQKKVDTNGDGGYETTERYAYDGWKTGPQKTFVGLENWDIWADLDGSSSLTTRYLRGDAIDQLLGRLGAKSGWLLTDRLGSVRGVADRDGVLKDTLGYDGFGNVVSESDATWSGRYAWTGRERDPETGLQYNRRRYYEPYTGRWTSEDPKGFAAGDSNLYRYVHNGYTLSTDPSGLQDVVRPLRPADLPSPKGMFDSQLQGLGFGKRLDPYFGKGPQLPPPTKSGEVGSLDLQRIPAQRIKDMIADPNGLAQEHKGYAFIADVTPAGFYYMVLERDGAYYKAVQVKQFPAEDPPDHQIKASRKNASLYVEGYIQHKDNEGTQFLAGVVNFVYHAVPFGAMWDHLHKGEWGEAGLSLVGDVAMFLAPAARLAKTAKGAKYLKGASIGGEALVGSVRLGQGFLALADGQSSKAIGYFGEATLRLLGLST